MNEAISRRKLLLLAVFGTSIALPATAMLLIASDAEAQQADQAAPPEMAPKRKRRRKRERKHHRCASGKTESPVIARP